MFSLLTPVLSADALTHQSLWQVWVRAVQLDPSDKSDLLLTVPQENRVYLNGAEISQVKVDPLLIGIDVGYRF